MASLDVAIRRTAQPQPRLSGRKSTAMSCRPNKKRHAGSEPDIRNKSKHGYVLEVVKFVEPENNDPPGPLPLYTHVGYMKPIFQTIDDACTYYDRHNPHMRSLNAHSTLCSDWDPQTYCAYIIRENHHICPSIPGFGHGDDRCSPLPTNSIRDSENCYTFQGVTWTAVTKTNLK